MSTASGLTMRAVRVQRFGGPEVLQVDCQAPLPEVGEDQVTNTICVPQIKFAVLKNPISKVMVRVIFAGINPVETYIREGRL
jgi:NADPH:quinone reductase-like Zn-dependent oxidoreductase